MLEGIDGSGKSTQVELLSRRLGLTPSSSLDRPIRSLYRQLISAPEQFPGPSTSFHLALADHAAVAERCPGLPGVVLDRYVGSAATDALAAGLHEDTVLPAIASFPRPALAVLIEVPVELAWRRRAASCSVAEAGGPHFLRTGESLECGFCRYQGAVTVAYRRLADLDLLGVDLLVLDGERPADVLAETIARAAEQALGMHANDNEKTRRSSSMRGCWAYC